MYSVEEEKPSEMKFLILLSDFSLLNFKHKNFLKKKFFFDSLENFCKKWAEQLLAVIFVYFFNILECNLNIALIGTRVRWIYPPLAVFEYQTIAKQNGFVTLFEHLFRQEMILDKCWLEIKNNKKIQDVSFLFFFVLYLYKISAKNKTKSSRLIVLNFSDTQFTNIFKWKKISRLAQKSGIILDFYDISGKNTTMCHYGAYKTKGLYCKLAHFFNEALVSEDFLNPVLVFFSSIMNRQIYILPLPTNSFSESNLIYHKPTIVCAGCFAILLLMLPKCFICGQIFLD